MTVTLDEVRAYLPGWPEDVLDQWLVKHANRPGLGWPPPEPLGDGGWKNLITKPLSWWRGVRWEQVEIPLEISDFSPADRISLAGMLAAYFAGVRNAYSAIDNGKQRTESVVQYLVKDGRLPRPIVAMQAPDGLHVVDGAHRVLAVMVRRRLPDQIAGGDAVPLAPLQPAWVGQHTSADSL